MDFISGEELLSLCGENGMRISQVMREREKDCFGLDESQIQQKMTHAYEIMGRAARESIEREHRSMGGLIGGEAKRIHERRESGRSVCGNILSKAVAYSMGVLEVNASMGLIVAAPTAGSSGVIPGVFLAVQEEFGFSQEEMVEALFTAGAVGYLITRNATVSGAEGGCQAEVGAASAMAAAAVAQLMGGTPEQALSAAADALANLLGLVCDPVGGLVEAPCQKRNAMGAANALVSAEMALGCGCGLIPFDEMVKTMHSVGRSMPASLRETALGGIAATPTACALCSGCK